MKIFVKNGQTLMTQFFFSIILYISHFLIKKKGEDEHEK